MNVNLIIVATGRAIEGNSRILVASSEGFSGIQIVQGPAKKALPLSQAI
ncbi:MAG: hypothetical protein WCB90_05175 [Methanosarcina sp.]